MAIKKRSLKINLKGTKAFVTSNNMKDFSKRDSGECNIAIPLWLDLKAVVSHIVGIAPNPLISDLSLPFVTNFTFHREEEIKTPPAAGGRAELQFMFLGVFIELIPPNSPPV